MRNRLLPLLAALAAGCGPAAPADPQLPPVASESELTAWVAAEVYTKWACEPALHTARSPSPHGKNRICSNAKLSAHGTGEYPVGAATVKELFDASDKRIGHAVAVKTKAGAGEAWHWYERLNGSTVVNSAGDTGTAKSVCVGCHAKAGSDSAHSGHDLIYTQVK